MKPQRSDHLAAAGNYAMNDIYRGFEIEKQADGFWLKLDGVYKCEAFATDADARRCVDAYILKTSR